MKLQKTIKYLVTETGENFEENICIIAKYNEDELAGAKEEFSEAKEEFSEAINDYPVVYLHKVEESLIPHYFNTDDEAERLIESITENAECNEDFGLLDASKELIKKTFAELKTKLLYLEQENFLYYHIETIDSNVEGEK